jgi:hypothetical protein
MAKPSPVESVLDSLALRFSQCVVYPIVADCHPLHRLGDREEAYVAHLRALAPGLQLSDCQLSRAAPALVCLADNTTIDSPRTSSEAARRASIVRRV